MFGSACLFLVSVIASATSAAAQSTGTSFYAELERIQNNLTALHTTIAPSWVSAPSMRGTSGIVYSCILTLFACIYTALHLNIPKRGAGAMGLLISKSLWSLAALTAPEIVLFYASFQFITARSIAKTLRGLAEIEASTEADAGAGTKANHSLGPAGEKYTFDLKYGFFAAMGGFEILYRGPEEAEPSLVTLSPDGVRKLAAQNLEQFKISRSSIEDRSKADTVQKGLVLFQVVWMALQCIARKAYGLPLSLLELHTMVHVVCAMAMYAFWIEKPLDIRSAEVLDPSKFPDLNDLDLGKHTQRQGSNLAGFKLSSLLQADALEIVGTLGDMGGQLVATVGLLLPAIYGGVHLSAWRFEFPTPIESLWKIACIIIAASIPVWYVASLLPIEIADAVAKHSKRLETVANFFFGFMVWFCGRLLIYVLAVCRFYIVVEAFVSLRSMPIGVYWTPAWIQMIPHL